MLGVIVIIYKDYMNTHIDPSAYTPLLNTIAKGESKGNYNAYFGNTTNNTILFTNMTVAQVLQWQEDYVKSGSPSSAVGKYQIVRPTLSGLVEKLHIDPSAKFDAALQDKLGVALLEKRGAVAYMQNKLPRDQFAANLAQEWAALPKVTGPDPQQSYYAGDGLNKVKVSTAEVFQALATIKK